MATDAEIDLGARKFDELWFQRCGEYLSAGLLKEIVAGVIDAAASVRAPMTRDRLIEIINAGIYMEMPIGQGERPDKFLITNAAADAVIAEMARIASPAPRSTVEAVARAIARRRAAIEDPTCIANGMRADDRALAEAAIEAYDEIRIAALAAKAPREEQKP